MTIYHVYILRMLRTLVCATGIWERERCDAMNKWISAGDVKFCLGAFSFPSFRSSRPEIKFLSTTRAEKVPRGCETFAEYKQPLNTFFMGLGIRADWRGLTGHGRDERTFHVEQSDKRAARYVPFGKRLIWWTGRCSELTSVFTAVGANAWAHARARASMKFWHRDFNSNHGKRKLRTTRFFDHLIIEPSV